MNRINSDKDSKLKPPPVLNGWGIFDKKELEDIKKKKLLRHVYAGVSAACDLHCIYCQTKSGKAMHGEMNLEERKDFLDQAKELGCQLVHIAARGEPTVDPLFLHQLQYIHKLGMIPVIFTHGGNIDNKWADYLWENEASVIIKIHSFQPELQDWFAGVKDYTKRRNRGLRILIEKGFNKTAPTRLGADILVMKKNYEEIEKIFRWCRKNNIFPLVKPFLCNERGRSEFVMKNLYLPPLKIKELYYKLAEIDRRDYGYYWEPAPPYAGINCNYYLYHIVVTIMGDIWPCIGLSHLCLGNIREKSLKECWESKTMERIRNIFQHIKGICQTCEKFKKEICYGCPCRRTYLGGPKKTFICNSCWEDNM